MLYPIVLNSSNLVSTSSNNTYQYNFPTGAVHFKKCKLAVASVALYYSWYNVSSSNNNNSFQFIFPGNGTYTVTLPDGFYSISELNSYLQNFCILNNLYLVNASGDYIYYLEFLTNSTYYSVQFNAYPVPVSLPSGYTNPGGMLFPGTSVTPQLVVLSNDFRNIIGFDAGTYPSTTQSSVYSALSSFTPQVTDVQSVLMTCSLLSNKYANPNTILYSFAIDTTFGSLLSSNPNQYSFINIYDGQYTQFNVQFFDQNFNPLQIRDTNVLIQLLIQTEDE